MKNNKQKYPIDLFVMGFFMNFIKNFFLLIPAIVLIVIGIWVKWCLIIGCSLFVVDIVFSLIEQIKIRNAAITSDNPNFAPWQEAMLSPNWKDNIRNMTEDVIEETDSEN